MNKVIMIGRTTRDIEFKTTQSGTSVVEFDIAVKRTFKNANGEYESDFFKCVAYNKTAEKVSNYVKKGDLIAVDGKLQTRNYTDREGKKVYVTEIIAENVEFLQGKKQEEPKFVEISPEDDIPF